MKRQTPLHIPSLVLLFTLISCSDYVDDYRSKWGVLQGLDKNLHLLTDDGELLKPSVPLDTALFKAGERYRALYMSYGTTSYYSIGSVAQLVEIENLQRVLVKNINTSDSLNSTNGDPISINQYPFIGGGFLNFDFNFDFNNKNVLHNIELVQDSLVGRVCRMRFLHLAKNDNGPNLATALVSFPIRTFDRSITDSLVVEVMQYDNQIRAFRIALDDSIPNF